jgi:hypothetical protein
MDYIIEEIYEIFCDTDKVLTVNFRVEGDGEDYYRELVDSDYYGWCNEHYITEGDNLTDYDRYDDEDEYMGDFFNHDKWNMYYSNEDMIIEYLYENYSDLRTLPSPKVN